MWDPFLISELVDELSVDVVACSRDETPLATASVSPFELEELVGSSTLSGAISKTMIAQTEGRMWGWGPVKKQTGMSAV